MYRLKQKATGDWLETTSQSEIQEDVASGGYEVEGVTARKRTRACSKPRKSSSAGATPGSASATSPATTRTSPRTRQGWGGDWSDLEPEIGFYDDSQPAVLENQIEQAASHGLSYFAFYDYRNDQTGAPQFDDAIKAFLQARNRESMKFMITPAS